MTNDKPIYCLCTVEDVKGKICNKIGFVDLGIGAEIQYPCHPHYLEIVRKRMEKIDNIATNKENTQK